MHLELFNSFGLDEATDAAPQTASLPDRDVIGSDMPPVVNYVWINENKADDSRLCSIPLHYIDRAYENARKYPKATFNVWVDYDFLDDTSRFFLESHFYITAPPNTFLKNLSEIQDYKNSKIFCVENPQNIWARVDLARLLVLEHCLKSASVNTAIYSDFDCSDIRLAEVESHLDKHDLAFGIPKEIPCLENSYIALRRTEKTQDLLLRLIDSTLEISRQGGCGYTPFFREVFDFADRLNFDKQVYDADDPGHMTLLKFGIPGLIHMKGYKISENPFYAECGLT